MNPQTQVIVQLAGKDGQPIELAGIEIDVRFYTRGQTRYTFILGRTDENGAVRAQLNEIERQLEENRRMFLMDYNTPLDDCDPVVGIIAPSVEELAEREVARRKWWPDKDASPETSNGAVRCWEQRFDLSQTAPNKFNLICERVETA